MKNRIIKFRAWDKDHMERNVCACYKNLDKKEITLMQYTGLKDKNGKEIYEGDIVKYNAPQEVGKVVEVLFPDDYNWLKECCGGLKIIGNIYENKNLIK